MSSLYHITPQAAISGLREEAQKLEGPLPLTVVDVFGPKYQVLLMKTERPIYCARCYRTLPTMEWYWEIARSRNIVCCEAP